MPPVPPSGYTPTPAPQSDQPSPPNLTNRQTVLPWSELKRILHPGELPWLIVACVLGVIGLAGSFIFVVLVGIDLFTGGDGSLGLNPSDPVYALLQQVTGVMFVLMLAPFLIYLARGLNYAQTRVNGVRMSPTQFPEGYRIVVEAAIAAGMRKVPDAYVISGSGVLNAFASGHAWRRFIVVHSDMFEIGGAARDPQALRFVIGHEVGHLAAGHVAYWRLLLTTSIRQFPILGNFLSRAQEYSADNFGFRFAGPAGAAGGIRALAAGKYLNANVNFHEFADRALTEGGLFVWASNLLTTHPILLWRAQALRDRTKPGRLFIKPRRTDLAATPTLPAGSDPTGLYPYPQEALRYLDAYPPVGPAQFGRVFPSPLPGQEIAAPDQSRYGERMLYRGWQEQGPPPQGPPPQGPPPQAPPQGPAPQGPAPQGPAAQGPAPQGPAAQGPAPQGPPPNQPPG